MPRTATAAGRRRVEHGVEERGVRGGRLVLASAKARTGSVSAEEHREHVARLLTAGTAPRRGQRRRTPAWRQPRRASTRAYTSGVHGAQRGQPGRHRQRVTRQRAGLVDRPGRRQPLHDLGPPAERRAGQPAAHHLAEREQVGGHPSIPYQPTR